MKITHLTKTQENLKVHEKRKYMPAMSGGEMAEMLELSDTDFKAAIVKMLPAMTDMLEMNARMTQSEGELLAKTHKM